MQLLEEILCEMNLLVEAANLPSPTAIKTAVENNLFVSMMYDDGKGGSGKSWRYIFPVYYAYGSGKDTGGVVTDPNKLYVRALQSVGSTKRGQFKWKLFRADKIKSWVNGEQTLFDTLESLKNKPNKAEAANKLISQLSLFKKGSDKQLGRTVAVCTKFNEPAKIKPEKQETQPQEIQPKPKVPKVNVAPKEVNPEQPNYITKTQVQQQPIPKPENTFDISNTNNYINNKNTIEAPATEPISKQQVEVPALQDRPQNQFNDGGYMTKNDVEDQPDIEDIEKDEEPLTEVFNKLLTRWKNLYN